MVAYIFSSKTKEKKEDIFKLIIGGLKTDHGGNGFGCFGCGYNEIYD